MTQNKTLLAAGHRFGLLIAVEFVASDDFHDVWLFQCDCGRKKLLGLKNQKPRALSCGCKSSRSNVALNMSSSSEYNIWKGMKKRCNSPKDISYRNYGGKGVSVCERWITSFKNFLDDMGRRPSLDHSLDRWPDSKGNYEPNNCRWATRSEQNRNTSQNRLVMVGGSPIPLVEAASLAKVNYHTFYSRVESGWDIERALSEPAATNGRSHSRLKAKQ